MYPTSTEFKSLVRASHKSVAQAQVWNGDNALLELDVVDGAVEDDARRGVRRTCQVQLFSPRPESSEVPVYATYANLAAAHATYADYAAAYVSYGQSATITGYEVVTVDNGIVPDGAFDPLSPFGNELRLWRGIEVVSVQALTYAQVAGSYANYATLASLYSTYGQLAQTTTTVTEDELVPLGVYVITTVEMEDGEGGVNITVTGQDRSLRISRNRWTQPYRIAKGTNVATAIQRLLEDRWDEVVCAFSPTDETTNGNVLGTAYDNDPWKDAQRIATANGLDLYFDGDGIARLEPARVYDDTTPDEVYLEDSEAMVLGVKRSLTTDATYNGVIAVGESSQNDTVYRAEVWDDDPDSPTYRYGAFGEVPKFYVSNYLNSTSAAQKAASALLAKSKGAQEAISWTQITDPSLEAGDAIGLVSTGTKVNRVLAIDRLTIPLRANAAMSAVARTIKTQLTDDEVIANAAAS